MPPIVHPLVCVMGEYTDMINMIPQDDLCDYLFYAEVVLHDKALKAFASPISFGVFLQAVGSYTRTAFGVSFRPEYVQDVKTIFRIGQVIGVVKFGYSLSH